MIQNHRARSVEIVHRHSAAPVRLGYPYVRSLFSIMSAPTFPLL